MMMRTPIIAAALFGSAVLVACGDQQPVTPAPAPEPFDRTIETIDEDPVPLTEDVNPPAGTYNDGTGDTTQDTLPPFDAPAEDMDTMDDSMEEFEPEVVTPETP